MATVGDKGLITDYNKSVLYRLMNICSEHGPIMSIWRHNAPHVWL